MPRRRGAASGLLIFVLGAWCAAVPFVGPLFNLTIGPDQAFDMTAGRFWLSLVPGVVAALGGLMLMRSANRASATLGAQVAMAGGIWLVVGPTVSMLWNDGVMQTGQPAGGTSRQVLELLLYFYGTGAAITALAIYHQVPHIRPLCFFHCDAIVRIRQVLGPSSRYRARPCAGRKSTWHARPKPALRRARPAGLSGRLFPGNAQRE